MNKKSCLNCGDMISGRADKMFCSDQCRASYNNRNKAPHEQHMRMVNTRLRRNRTILKSLCPIGKATVRKEVLDEMGFNFNYCTSFFGKPGKMYFYCYEYGYMPIIEKSLTEQRPVYKVLIVQKQKSTKNSDPWKVL